MMKMKFAAAALALVATTAIAQEKKSKLPDAVSAICASALLQTSDSPRTSEQQRASTYFMNGVSELSVLVGAMNKDIMALYEAQNASEHESVYKGLSDHSIACLRYYRSVSSPTPK